MEDYNLSHKTKKRLEKESRLKRKTKLKEGKSESKNKKHKPQRLQKDEYDRINQELVQNRDRGDYDNRG